MWWASGPGPPRAARSPSTSPGRRPGAGPSPSRAGGPDRCRRSPWTRRRASAPTSARSWPSRAGAPTPTPSWLPAGSASTATSRSGPPWSATSATRSSWRRGTGAPPFFWPLSHRSCRERTKERRRCQPLQLRRLGRLRGLGLLGQAEDPLAHDVPLDLGRTAPDGLRPGEEERRLERGNRVVLDGIAPGQPGHRRLVVVLAAAEDLALHAED